MKNKNIYIFLLMFLVCILSISAISATQDTVNKQITSTDNNVENNIETNICYDDVSISNMNDKLILEENNGRDEESGYRTDKTTESNDDPLTFTELNKTINDNTNSTIYLSQNYKYNNASDTNFKNGIPISRNLTIYGNQVTIDGSKMARIFNLTYINFKVEFYNINFINGHTVDQGGAIYGGNAYNCTFTENEAENDGGAIAYGNATNCNFINNKARWGGAIFDGNAYDCIFTDNEADKYGGAIAYGNAYNCNFTKNTASTFTVKSCSGGAIAYGNAYNCNFINNKAKWGGAIAYGNAYNCTFFENTATQEGEAMASGNAILCIFNNDTIYETDIIPAIINVLNYTSPYQSGERLVFNLTADGILYDGFNTTIEIFKDGSIVKTVYGLTGEGWVVDLNPGEYTARLSLTDYPDEQASNATITVIQLTKITTSPVTTTYNVGKNLVITLKDSNGNPISGAVLTVKLGSTKKYNTNDNGQVKINVGTITPKTYTAKITYAGSDIFNPSTASVKVTVKKAKPKITVKSARYKLNVKTKKYTATFKTNKNQALKNTKVTLKVNGKTYSVKTNNKGQGVFKITNLRKIGSYIAVITVPANKYYNKVTKNVKITVKI